MNEPNLATYESYFCSNQVFESALSSMDYDIPQSIHYLNTGSCDLVPSSVDQRQQTSIYPFQQERMKDPATNLRGTTSSGVATGPSTDVYGNIPFVQIHTTDVQPQPSYGNVFRRHISRQEEIKSEPIKSESADATKERINATPTPPRAPSATQSQNGDSRTIATQCQKNNRSTRESNDDNMQCANSNENEDTCNMESCHIYKCSKCAYISLKESERDDHEASQHVVEAMQQRIERAETKCPGCNNTFFVQQSLEVHLQLDHLMSDDDVSKLVQYLVKRKSAKSHSTTNEHSENQHIPTEDVANKGPQRKSRIYLKNVECLREPNRHPMEQTENQLTENPNNKNANRNHKTPKQKISIKSVDVLREPALLRRNYESESTNYSLYLNDSDILNNQMSALNVPSTYDEYNQNADSLLTSTANLNNNDSNVINSNVCSSTETPTKPRRPKIYVKSVESFNLMPMDAIHSTNTDFMGDHNNLCSSTAQGYDCNIVHLPFIYESNTTVNNNANYMGNHTDLESSYQLINNSNQNGNYLLENPLYITTNVENININGGEIENVNLITEPTPSPPSNIVNVTENSHFNTNKSFPPNQDQRGTLHLRTVHELNLMDENAIQHSSNVGDTINFNANKTFPPNQEQRGTLHLRTVDELNLMNENEVQHLIAPNLDNNHSSESACNNLNINSVNLIGDAIYETETFKFQDLDSQMANDWPETYEDLAEDINGIITDVTNSNHNDNASYSIQNTQKNSNNLDIDTPQVSLITIRDIEEMTGGTGMGATQYANYINDNSPQELLIDEETENTSEEMENISSRQDINLNVAPSPSDTSENLKRELSNDTVESNGSPPLENTSDNELPISSTSPSNAVLSSVEEISPTPPESNLYLEIVDTVQNRPRLAKLSNNQTSAATTKSGPPLVLSTDSSNKSVTIIAEAPRSPRGVTCAGIETIQLRPLVVNNIHTHINATTATELPPLVPVTNSAIISSTSPSTIIVSTPPAKINDVSVPPLVPVPPLIKINKAIAKAPLSPSAPVEKTIVTRSTRVEKGRIYVANNLMEPSKKPIAVSATSGTSVRGRPFGSNRTRITQLKQKQGISAEDLFVKCSIKGCAFRFKKTETLEYHKKCHDISSSNPQATICPECKSTEFNNWNTLHTHLWRAHQIDMELYKCELCEFKTPIFSRLVNTHAKIHFDDRNYKCEQCGKGFKNSKQLKNHRRWHRVQSGNVGKPPTDKPRLKEPPSKIHRCECCGSTFSHQKTLREHCCKNSSETSAKCDICQKTMSTKASLKLHLLTHSDDEKRYKCQQCDYATNDHNAFRRHRMGHDNKKMYECQFCEYKSVQSVTYQKHIRHKHPDKANDVIHKCNECPFTTINRSLLFVHQAKHEQLKDDTTDTNNQKECSPGSTTNKSKRSTSSDRQKSKIKVKSNLFTL